MGWLEPHVVLPMAGYTVPDPLAGTREARAIAYAEQLISAVTDPVWGEVRTETLRLRLTTRSLLLPLPAHVHSAAVVEPSGYDTVLTRCGLERTDGSAFEPGIYLVEVELGFSTIPEDVNKAASLLVQHYLQLADAERSRLERFTLGDLSGSMRLSSFPVPEAAQLLRRYRREVEVA